MSQLYLQSLALASEDAETGFILGQPAGILAGLGQRVPRNNLLYGLDKGSQVMHGYRSFQTE